MCGRTPAVAASFSLSFWFTSSRWRPFFRACLRDRLTFFSRSRSCLFRFSSVATFCCSFLTWSSSSNRAFCTEEHMSWGDRCHGGRGSELQETGPGQPQCLDTWTLISPTALTPAQGLLPQFHPVDPALTSNIHRGPSCAFYI